MILVRPEDAIHKAHLLRLLTEILDSSVLNQVLFFKGGTCASMLGILDRFSVDLDFDLKKGVDEAVLRKELHALFAKLGLNIKNESKIALEFFLKYESGKDQRNTLKVDALNLFVAANKYAPFYLPELDRTAICQTKDTIFANKLVALLDRYKRNGTIAGRDVYDIHHFFMQGLEFNAAVIEERTGKSVGEFFKEEESFVRERVTATILDQDLNTLLPNEVFQKVRKTLKQEVLGFLSQAAGR